MKFLLSIFIGAISGGLCLWLDYLPFEFLHDDSYTAIYYTEIVLTIALLAQGKMLGMVTVSGIITRAIVLVVAAVLAQVAIFEYYQTDLLEWELGLYLPPNISGELLYELFLNSLFPTPVAGAIQAVIISIGVSLAWNFPATLKISVSRAALYSALFSALTIALVHLATEPFNVALNEADQTRYAELIDRAYYLFPITALVLWYSFLLLAIYLAVRPKSEPMATTDIPLNDQVQPEALSIKAKTTERVHSGAKATASEKWVSTPQAIEILTARHRVVKLFTWVLLTAALVFIVALTHHYQTKENDFLTASIDNHKALLNKHAKMHPLYLLWPEIRKCGGDLQSMTDLLGWSREADESVLACESRLLNRLDDLKNSWKESLDSTAESLQLNVDSRLLIKEHLSDEPFDLFLSVLRICDVGNYDLKYFHESLENNESISEHMARRLECIKDELELLEAAPTYVADIQLIITEMAAMVSEDKWIMDSASDYFYFYPHKVWKSGPGDGWEHWDTYRPKEADYGELPAGSFLKALNLAWKSGGTVHPSEKDDELRPYENREMQLITPIVIDGVTQGLILTEVPDWVVNNYSVDEWQSYRQLLTLVLFSLMLLFLLLEHRTLGTIPKSMNLTQWRAGMWRPSLLTLYRANNFRHRQLFNLMFFVPFSALILFAIDPHELFRYGVTWTEWLLYVAGAMSLPLIFVLVTLPRVKADYRLFAKGIAVPCKEQESVVETIVNLHSHSDEYYERTNYQVSYKGKLYHISAPTQLNSPATAIALIDPGHEGHGLLLNAFTGNS